MPLRLDVPGLDAFVPPVGDGWVVLVEGGTEPDKEFFADLVCRSARQGGQRVLVVTSRGAATVARRQGLAGEDRARVVLQEAMDFDDLAAVRPVAATTLVDAVSFMAQDADPAALSRCVQAHRSAARQDGHAVVLVAEDDVLDARSLGALRHLSDAVVQFRTHDDGEKIQSFLRVPRWGALHSVRQPVHYSFTGDRLAIDTRRRHV